MKELFRMTLEEIQDALPSEQEVLALAAIDPAEFLAGLGMSAEEYNVRVNAVRAAIAELMSAIAVLDEALAEELAGHSGSSGRARPAELG